MTVAFSVARVLVLLLLAERAWGQTSLGPPPANLKKLSLDALRQIEVTSVSTRPEQLSGAPSSVQVITGEDIRRSGATSPAEALRFASSATNGIINIIIKPARDSQGNIERNVPGKIAWRF
jgi:hypothetical protein